ncbi:hypothetical protein [Streptomyces sp. NPDC095613]|uniref:hypothetical protein n=1 Tax=Streptomyces sp. NPDC095613 TaxID=3155540 RepID=UPI003322A640
MSSFKSVRQRHVARRKGAAAALAAVAVPAALLVGAPAVQAVHSMPGGAAHGTATIVRCDYEVIVQLAPVRIAPDDGAPTRDQLRRGDVVNAAPAVDGYHQISRYEYVSAAHVRLIGGCVW